MRHTIQQCIDDLIRHGDSRAALGLLDIAIYELDLDPDRLMEIAHRRFKLAKRVIRPLIHEVLCIGS